MKNNKTSMDKFNRNITWDLIKEWKKNIQTMINKQSIKNQQANNQSMAKEIRELYSM